MTSSYRNAGTHSHSGPLRAWFTVSVNYKVLTDSRPFGHNAASISSRALCYKVSMQFRHQVSLARLVPRFAAMVVATAFAAVAGCEVFWALGGSRGLSGAWGGSRNHLPVGLRLASAFVAFLLVAGAMIVLGRARYWASHDRLGILRWGTWALVAVMTLSAIANFASSSSLERFQNGPVALLLALLCLIVARSQ